MCLFPFNWFSTEVEVFTEWGNAIIARVSIQLVFDRSRRWRLTFNKAMTVSIQLVFDRSRSKSSSRSRDNSWKVSIQLVFDRSRSGHFRHFDFASLLFPFNWFSTEVEA